ncbi:hypothetical protein [Nocardia sp. NPDC059228]|uniref:hypothetical protein n=1 Tax=Nocardia sp. NPDC059228 TaxID=3346777 RepID=UPI0036BDA799
MDAGRQTDPRTTPKQRREKGDDQPDDQGDDQPDTLVITLVITPFATLVIRLVITRNRARPRSTPATWPRLGRDRENLDYPRSACDRTIGGQDGRMATKDVVLSLDVVALSLAERAAELSGDSLSEVVSACLNRHLLTDYAPPE